MNRLIECPLCNWLAIKDAMIISPEYISSAFSNTVEIIYKDHLKNHVLGGYNDNFHFRQ